jgi:hypothetical protein
VLAAVLLPIAEPLVAVELLAVLPVVPVVDVPVRDVLSSFALVSMYFPSAPRCRQPVMVTSFSWLIVLDELVVGVCVVVGVCALSAAANVNAAATQSPDAIRCMYILLVK